MGWGPTLPGACSVCKVHPAVVLPSQQCLACHAVRCGVDFELPFGWNEYEAISNEHADALVHETMLNVSGVSPMRPGDNKTAPNRKFINNNYATPFTEERPWKADMVLRDARRIIRQHSHKDVEFKPLCTYAAGAGNLKVLELLRKETPPSPWDSTTTSAAAKNGHLDVLKWIVQQPDPPPVNHDAVNDAVQSGYVEVLAWMVSSGYAPFVINMHVAVMRWMEDKRYAPSVATIVEAAKYGRLDVLKWAMGQPNPPPLTAEAVSAAAKNGNMRVLEWIMDQDKPPPVTKNAVELAAKNKNFSVLSRMMDVAAKHGDLRIIEALMDQDKPPAVTANVVEAIVKKGKLSLLKRAWKSAQCFDKNEMLSIATGGRVDANSAMVRWLREKITAGDRPAGCEPSSDD